MNKLRFKMLYAFSYRNQMFELLEYSSITDYENKFDIYFFK